MVWAKKQAKKIRKTGLKDLLVCLRSYSANVFILDIAALLTKTKQVKMHYADLAFAESEMDVTIY